MWLLCDDRSAVVSSCETVRMASSIRGKQGSAYAFASVFTEPALRGAGWASAMMNLVIRELPARASDLQASILFSDVGAAMYQRSGFDAVPAHDWTFPPDDRSPGPRVAEVDELIPESRLAESWRAISRPVEPFSIWPTPEQVDWHVERERSYSEMLGRIRPNACGARLGRSAIFWAAKYATDELVVLHLAAERPDEAEALLRCAQRAAHGASLRRVRWWECPLSFELPPGFAGGQRTARKNELPMLRPFHPGVRAKAWQCIPRAVWV